MNIATFRPFTLMDYPGKIAALVFTSGCNFSCGFCHNPSLVPVQEKNLLPQEFLSFLATRQGKLQGVVISGGEPTMQAGLIPFIETIRELGFAIKLDTNGSSPEVLQQLINGQLVDYVAMDIKAPPAQYPEICGVFIDPQKITESINLIIAASDVDHEFRTTAIKQCLSEDDLITCGLWVRGGRRYILQSFFPQQTLDPQFQQMVSYRPEELVQISQRLLKLGVNCQVR